MQILYQDASNNYDASRYQDAINGFTYLMSKSFERNNIELFLYFSYRAYTSTANLDEPLQQLSILRKTSVSCLKLAARKMVTMVESENDVYQKNLILEEFQKVLLYLDEPEKRYHILIKLVENYRILANEHDVTLEEKLGYLESCVKHLVDLEDYDDTKSVLKELATAYEESAKIKESLGVDIVESNYIYQKALDIYDRMNDNESINRVRSKIVV